MSPLISLGAHFSAVLLFAHYKATGSANYLKHIVIILFDTIQIVLKILSTGSIFVIASLSGLAWHCQHKSLPLYKIC